MRSTTAGEDTILDAATKNNYYKVEIKDAGGTYRDLGHTEYYGYNLVEGWSIDWNVDQPVGELRVSVRRDVGTSLSFAPLMTGSSTYTTGPAIDVGRDIRVFTATTEAGVAPDVADWKNMFEGVIDVVEWEASPIQIIARDNACKLVDRWVESETQYGSADAMDIEDVMQEILDDWADGPPTLYTPSTPSFLISPVSKWKHVSVMDALLGHVRLIGWDIRYKWDDGTSAWRLTFYEPPRSNTTPDWTFGPNRIMNVNQMRIDRDPIRNVIDVTYLDSSTGDRATETYTNSTSVTRFGRRWMLIEEGGDSPIDTSAEAQALADAVGADLSAPTAEQTVEMSYFWPVELHDLLRFSDNAIHYDADQDLAVTSIRHEFSFGRERTIIGVRGQPQGFYLNWHKLKPRGKPEKIKVAAQTFVEQQGSNPFVRNTAVGIYVTGGTATGWTPVLGIPSGTNVKLTGLRMYSARSGSSTVVVKLYEQSTGSHVTVATLTSTAGAGSEDYVAFSEDTAGKSYLLEAALVGTPGAFIASLTWVEIDYTVGNA